MTSRSATRKGDRRDEAPENGSDLTVASESPVDERDHPDDIAHTFSLQDEPQAEDQPADPAPTDPAHVNTHEIIPVLEALLFVSQEPLGLERAMMVLDLPRAEVLQGFRRLQDSYETDGRGLQVVEVAGGYRLVTRADYAPWLKRLEKVKPAPKLSRSALEALAIVAYKQPIVRAEIEQIRGVETSSVLRTLLERKLVRMVGRKEVPGRPIMYGTTKYFLEHFGLRDLSELPPLREFKELGESEQAFLPVDDTFPPADDPLNGANTESSPELSPSVSATDAG